jgi:hypothetical protein
VSELADEHDHDDHDHDHDHDHGEVDQDALEAMLETIRSAQVAPLILSTVSTFTSVAYGKLEMKDLPETKTAIDAIDALLPILRGKVEDGILRDFEQALTNLKLAYADTVGASD